jgi:hypothetical protein
LQARAHIGIQAELAVGLDTFLEILAVLGEFFLMVVQYPF